MIVMQVILDNDVSCRKGFDYGPNKRQDKKESY